MSENENKQMTQKEFEEQIIKKAQSDKEFKKALVDNPKEALGQLGVQLPEDVEVKVVEESARVVYLVLPVNPDELTNEQLDGASGGLGCPNLIVCINSYSDSCASNYEFTRN